MLPRSSRRGLQRSLQVQRVDGPHRRCQQQNRRQAHRLDYRNQWSCPIRQGFPRLLGTPGGCSGGDRDSDG